MSMDKLHKTIMNRTYFVGVVLGLFAFVLIGKLVYIQIVQGEYYTELADQRTIKNVVLEPSRGNIYAADGSILATSVPRYELRWDAKVPINITYGENREALAKGLANYFNEDSAVWLQKLDRARKQNNRYFLVAKDLPYSAYLEIKALPLFRLSPYRGGLIVEQQIVREHPLGKIAERTVGYEQQDVDGTFFRVGLEGAYSQYLRGEEGRRLKQKIANGQWKPINTTNEKEPTEGYEIYTTIDVNIQDIAHNALLAQLEQFEAEHGTVVVMEAKTGAVKAIANLGRTTKGMYYEKLNYAIGEAHEPGSTFKLIGMMAALEDKVITEEDIIDTGNGVLTFYGKYKVRDSKRGGYGKLSAAKVFEVSSNTGMVKIITDHYGKQPKKFIDRLYNIGLNKPLGVEIKGEAQPKIPYPTDNDWDGLDLPWMAFGYGVSVTPLQTLSVYNAIANNGVMVKPQFIQAVGNLGAAPLRVVRPQVLNPSVCSQATVKKLQGMMFNVVDKKWGTANRIKDPHLTMAGKTGTCQVEYTSDEVQYISSFVGYFPAEQPKYSCIVVIHKPNKKKGYYGATVAAPVFKKIAKKIFNATPVEVPVAKETLDALVDTTPKTVQIPEQLPDFRGMNLRDALLLLEKMGIAVKLQGTGKITRQSVRPGTALKTVATLTLELS